jgi:septation ring formation regulator EzrA
MNDGSREDLRRRLGNIEQLRDIIIGPNLQACETQIEDCRQRIQALEAQFEGFKAEMRDRLDQFQAFMLGEQQGQAHQTEERLTHFGKLQQEGTRLVDEKLTHLQNSSQAAIDGLHKDLVHQVQGLKTDLFQSRQQLESAIQGLEYRVFKEMQYRLEHLQAEQLSRQSLADLLFDVCLSLKSESVPPEGQSPPSMTATEHFHRPERSDHSVEA